MPVEFEEVTFHQADVVQLAEKSFIMVKIDVTKGGIYTMNNS